MALFTYMFPALSVLELPPYGFQCTLVYFPKEMENNVYVCVCICTLRQIARFTMWKQVVFGREVLGSLKLSLVLWSDHKVPKVGAAERCKPQ